MSDEETKDLEGPVSADPEDPEPESDEDSLEAELDEELAVLGDLDPPVDGLDSRGLRGEQTLKRRTTYDDEQTHLVGSL